MDKLFKKLVLCNGIIPILLVILAIALVVRVVDGDTVMVYWDNGVEDRVRLIGINTPERGQLGYMEAKRYLKTLVLNRLVEIEADVKPRDTFNRYLGYLWVDDIFVNLEMVKSGFAEAKEYPPNLKYAAEFSAAKKN